MKGDHPLAHRVLVTDQLCGKRLFVVDTFCGANPDSRLKVRFVTEVAWQAHFVTNMFIRPDTAELADYEPDFVVLNGSKTTNPDYQAIVVHRTVAAEDSRLIRFTEEDPGAGFGG